MDEERLRKLAELPDLTPDDIRGLRYNVKLTQEELANKLDVSTTSVRNWEKGEASPLPPVKEKIFDSFDREDISPPPDEWNGIMYTTDILETDILEAIELCADEIGHTPTITEYKEWRANTSDDYPYNTIARSHFNGWREAVSEAGLDYPYGYTKEELVEAIELCADEMGHTPTTTEYEEWRANTSDDYPSANTISRNINGSWKGAVSKAGFDKY
jgi:DNA-binding XRE family transcriptional regulator